jgi:RND family efflux transporter MFP subunit
MDSSKPSLDGLRIKRKDDHQRGWPLWVTVLAALILLLVIGAVVWQTRTARIEVHTVVARETANGGRAQTVLNASGYVIARREATVSSKVTGKIVEVLIEEGMSVTNGQVLARLDDVNVRANLDVARAQLESARAALEETRALLRQAELELERTSRLAEQHIAAQAELDRAASEAESLRARLVRQERDVTVSESQIDLWQQQVEDLVIRAPFDGIVTSKNAQPGEMISPVSAGGGFTRTGIGTIVDMSSLEIEIDVNESYINRVRPEQPVDATLDAYPDWRIPCKVIAIIPTADRQKSTVRVRVGFDELDPRILPQMAVKVAFRDDRDTAAGRTVLIPKSSVQSDDDQDVVFVVRNGTAERRAVRVDRTQGEEVTVRSGVTSGERIIVNPPPGLQDGAAIKETNS